ncbi:PD-(D/E)XK nuclease domain-containing protein [Kushneria sp. Sum13]|uniref:PD-(D/E)XK nuclease domain-containing protein n=1 Tax=Kushneria sp. Sum13 TaxID=3459196 RepID=UPI004046066E
MKEYLSFASALLDSMNQSLKASSESDVWKHSSYQTYMRKYNSLVREVAAVTSGTALLDLYDLDRVPSMGDTIAIQQKSYFDSVHSNLSILKAFLENKIGLKEDKTLQIKDFIQANLRRAMFDRPDKEILVQDVVEQLLIGRGMEKGVDYDRETGRVKISIKEVVPDFIFQKLGLALEVKLSKTTTKSKTIVDEINADIMAYSREYRSIIFLVYDIGSIRDETEFKNDLEVNDAVSVIVIKH